MDSSRFRIYQIPLADYELHENGEPTMTTALTLNRMRCEFDPDHDFAWKLTGGRRRVQFSPTALWYRNNDDIRQLEVTPGDINGPFFCCYVNPRILTPAFSERNQITFLNPNPTFCLLNKPNVLIEQFRFAANLSIIGFSRFIRDERTVKRMMAKLHFNLHVDDGVVHFKWQCLSRVPINFVFQNDTYRIFRASKFGYIRMVLTPHQPDGPRHPENPWSIFGAYEIVDDMTNNVSHSRIENNLPVPVDLPGRDSFRFSILPIIRDTEFRPKALCKIYRHFRPSKDSPLFCALSCNNSSCKTDAAFHIH